LHKINKGERDGEEKILYLGEQRPTWPDQQYSKENKKKKKKSTEQPEAISSRRKEKPAKNPTPERNQKQWRPHYSRIITPISIWPQYSRVLHTLGRSSVINVGY